MLPPGLPRGLRRLLLTGLAAGSLAVGSGPVGPATAAAPATAPAPHSRVSVTITTTPRIVHAGELVTFHVALRSADSGLALTRWSFGDGSATHVPQYAFSCPTRITTGPPMAGVRPSAGGTTSSTDVETLGAIYRTAGRHTFTVTAGHLSGCAAGPQASTDSGTGTAAVTVDVQGPDARGNGPGTPDPGSGVHGSDTGSGTATLSYLTAEDPDGLVRSVTLTIDQGRPQRYLTGRRCADPTTYWRPSRWMRTVDQTLRPGAHTITVTAVSVACNGTALQTTTVLRRLVVNALGCFSDRHTLAYSPALVPGNPQLATQPTPAGVTYGSVPDRPGPTVCG